MIAIYPGTFDPITYGHRDIITRAVHLFDTVIVAIVQTPAKKTLFTAAERLALAKKVTAGLPVVVELFDGLLAAFAHEKKAGVIVRGLRAVSDFEYEFQLAVTNKQLNPHIDTLFLMTDKQYFYISSSLLKEIASMKGNVQTFVPPEVQRALAKKFSRH